MKTKVKNLLSFTIAVCLVLSAFAPARVKSEDGDFLSSFKVSKTTIYKGNSVSVSVNSAKSDKNELKIEFKIKNNSKNDYSIAAHEFAINNLMAGGSTYGSDVKVPAGKKAKLTVSVKKEWFEENGIKTFKKFDVVFWGYKDFMKEWESEKVFFSTDKDNGKGYYKPNKKSDTIYSDDNMSINYLSKKDDTYRFCLKNNTGIEKRWSIENCSINDWSYDLGSCKYDLYSEPILDGCYAVFDLQVDKKFKENNSIKKVKKIEFNVNFEGQFDNDYNYTEGIESEKIIFKNKK